MGTQKLTNGTTYRSTPAGLVLMRGKRELHLLGTSVSQQEKARALVVDHSFAQLFARARRTPATGRSVAYLRIAA